MIPAHVDSAPRPRTRAAVASAHGQNSSACSAACAIPAARVPRDVSRTEMSPAARKCATELIARKMRSGSSGDARMSCGLRRECRGQARAAVLHRIRGTQARVFHTVARVRDLPLPAHHALPMPA